MTDVALQLRGFGPLGLLGVVMMVVVFIYLNWESAVAHFLFR